VSPDGCFPLIHETGLGVDLHGEDPTKAARRAVQDAIRRVSFPGLAALLPDGDRANMRVEVTVAVPGADRVRADEVAAELPYGRVRVTAVEGGLRHPSGLGAGDLIACVALLAVGW
jgi:uncharacterized protein (TIGR02058 family)